LVTDAVFVADEGALLLAFGGAAGLLASGLLASGFLASGADADVLEVKGRPPSPEDSSMALMPSSRKELRSSNKASDSWLLGALGEEAGLSGSVGFFGVVIPYVLMSDLCVKAHPIIPPRL